MTNNDNNNVNNNSGNQTPRFDNLKAKLASKAATAAGGPAAGKAVDTLNKIRNNPNNNGYANNKRNRLGQAGNTSNDNSSGLDENSSNGTTNTKQNSNNNLLGRLGSILGGNNSDKINENDSTVTKAVKTAKKIRKAMPIIAALAPFIMSFLGLIIIVVIVMSQFAAIENFVAEIQVGVEKMLNFTSGEGWVTNETAFFTRLKDENAKYQQLSNNGENLDLALIAATIHYDRLVDPSVYEQKDIGNKEYNEKTQDTAIVEKDQTASFYGVANHMLGKVDTVIVGERKLLGHLVKTKIRYVEFNGEDNVLSAWTNYFTQAGVSIKEDICGPTDFKCYARKTAELFKDTASYAEKFDNILAYTDFELLNKSYEAKEFIDGFSSDDASEEQKESGNWVPVVTREMDYETYKNYLRNVYIPFNYFYGAKKEDVDPLEVEKIVEEIFAQRDYYNYLFHPKVEDGFGEICYSNLSNVKVKLYSCGSGHTGVEKYYVETVSFDDYVKGVILAEEGGVITNKSNEEFIKAFILTAKSYTLGRGVRYMNPSYFDLNSPVIEVELQNCSNDQNYKSYKNATSGQKEVIERLYSEVSNQILVTNADSTRVKQAGYMNNAAHACGSHDCSEGNGSIMNVTEAAKLSQQGYTYDKILTYYYGSKYAIKNIDNDCRSVNIEAVSGEFTKWKQYSGSWSQIPIGCGTVHKCGCLATSVTIQIANAAQNGGLKLKVDKFDPYVFITTLKRNGGFSSSGSFMWRGWNSITDNWYCVAGTYLNGNIQQKAMELKNKISEGWYPIVNVKYGGCGQHWVAILAVNGTSITMADPASTQTDLSKSKYSCFVNGKQSWVRYCRVK